VAAPTFSAVQATTLTSRSTIIAVMLRRHAVSLFLAALASKLDRFLVSGSGAAVLIDVPTRRTIATTGEALAERSLLPPGSTVKPFVLSSLIKSGKLSPNASYACPARLRIGNRTLDCSHPPLAMPMRVDTALAYSCNCFVAHAAERFGPGELARELERAGFAGGQIRPAADGNAIRLQALGEQGVLVTVSELALAYRSLAMNLGLPEMQLIRAGLEGAVEFGTAQNAGVSGVKVAGKTGTALTSAGETIAWFAGFLPSVAPQVAIAVMVHGRSGGADAAPIAGRILEAYRAGRL
jgi:membrane peptidoglycan carboxypeptidase